MRAELNSLLTPSLGPLFLSLRGLAKTKLWDKEPLRRATQIDSSAEFILSAVEWTPKKHIDLSPKKPSLHFVIPTGVMQRIT